MVVHPFSHGVPRVPRYSGYSLSVLLFAYGALTRCGRPSHAVRLSVPDRDASPYPEDPEGPSVWPPPRSLATTCGISVDVFSSPYLDVSVQAVPHHALFDSGMVDVVLPRRVSPFGNLRINAYLPLPEAYRSLSRPSSAPSAKAFPLRSFLLDLVRLRHRLKRQSAEMVLNHIAVLRIMQASTEVFTNRSDYPFVIPQFVCLFVTLPRYALCCLATFFHHKSLFSFQGAGRRHCVPSKLNNVRLRKQALTLGCLSGLSPDMSP